MYSHIALRVFSDLFNAKFQGLIFSFFFFLSILTEKIFQQK